MTAFSDYLENALVNATLRNISYTSPAAVYLGLHTTATNDDNSGTEVSTSGTGYARTAVVFAAPSNGSTTNNGTVTFPTATASWGTVSHFGIYDGTGPSANLLYWGALTVTKTVDSADIFTVPSGNLTVTLQ